MQNSRLVNWFKKLLTPSGERPDPRQVRPPSGVSRRDFLRALGVTTVTVAVAPLATRLWLPAPNAPQPFGKVKFIGRSECLEDLSLLNGRLFEQLAQSGQQQAAIDAVNEFTRTKMREDSFYRKILPPLQIANDELDRSIDTDLPVRFGDPDFVPDAADLKLIQAYHERIANERGAISIPFAELPTAGIIKGKRYKVTLDRIPKFGPFVSTPHDTPNPLYELWQQSSQAALGVPYELPSPV
jgi:hypothetical protein